METEDLALPYCLPCNPYAKDSESGPKLFKGKRCIVLWIACVVGLLGAIVCSYVSFRDASPLQTRVAELQLASRPAPLASSSSAANRKAVNVPRKLDSSETADCDSMYDVAQNLKANNSYMLSLVYLLGFLSCLFVIVFGSIWLGRRLKPLAPRYWSAREDSWSIAKFFNDNYREEVDVTDELRDKMQQIIDSTTDPTRMGKGRDGNWAKHKGFEVIKVTRIENGKLWTRYQRCKSDITPCEKTISEEMAQELRERAQAAVQLVKNANTRVEMCIGKFLQLDSSRCETMLFHGSPGVRARNHAGDIIYEKEEQSPVGVIKQQGFDDRLGSVSGMLGSGTYFADKASKADCYSGRYNKFGDDYTSVGEVATMFLSRVVMGTPYLTRQSLEQLRRPPCVHSHFDPNLTFRSVTIGKPWLQKEDVHFQVCEHPRFDSVISDLSIDGMTKLYREFVVYDKQSYPEFCITYRRLGTTPSNAMTRQVSQSGTFSSIFGKSSG